MDEILLETEPLGRAKPVYDSSHFLTGVDWKWLILPVQHFASFCGDFNNRNHRRKQLYQATAERAGRHAHASFRLQMMQLLLPEGDASSA